SPGTNRLRGRFRATGPSAPRGLPHGRRRHNSAWNGFFQRFSTTVRLAAPLRSSVVVGLPGVGLGGLGSLLHLRRGVAGSILNTKIGVGSPRCPLSLGSYHLITKEGLC